MAPDADRARRAIPGRLAEAADSGAARDPRDRLGGDENSAMIVEWGFSIVCGTSKLLDQSSKTAPSVPECCTRLA